jgi:hypothetical protein
MPIPKLTEIERSAALAALPDWTLRRDGLAIERELKFRDFSEAFAWPCWRSRPTITRSGRTCTTRWRSR